MDPELEAFVPLFPPADPAVAVRLYHSHGAIVWLHGGGFVMGDLDTEHPAATRVADACGAVVVSVGYRVAPEHRFPAALDDAYAALTWTAEHAADLGIDPARIAVAGMSAGGGLAAAVALRARDQQGPPVRLPLLNQPALDDRQQTWSARQFTDTPWMTRDKVTATWRHYLGTQPATAYAAPAREARPGRPASGLIATAEFDPNRDEAIGYGLGLLRAGCRWSCTSGRAPSTGRRRSCPPRCPSGRSPSSPRPPAAPWPTETAMSATPCRNPPAARPPHQPLLHWPGHPGLLAQTAQP